MAFDKFNLDYLHSTPKRIRWKVIAGGELSRLQREDVIFDKYDLKIRGLL